MQAQSRSARAQQTRFQLMRAAEHLFAEHGIENVPVRTIIHAAGQRNESALHYHFGDREGLIRALQEERSGQLDQQRQQLIAQFIERGQPLAVRDLCELMVKPAFLLCRADASFREFLGVFGQLLLSSSRSIIATLRQDEINTMQEIRRQLTRHLPDMDEQLFASRFDDTARFATLAMSKRARERGSFRGKHADYFINNLLDVMAAMLVAPVSKTTQALR